MKYLDLLSEEGIEIPDSYKLLAIHGYFPAGVHHSAPLETGEKPKSISVSRMLMGLPFKIEG